MSCLWNMCPYLNSVQFTGITVAGYTGSIETRLHFIIYYCCLYSIFTAGVFPWMDGHWRDALRCIWKQNEASSLYYECYWTSQPFYSRLYICRAVLYCVFCFLPILQRFFLFLPKLHWPWASSIWYFDNFRRASAAWTDIKILQTLCETTLCKRGWARKAFEILSLWGLAVFDGTLPVTINDHFAASCFVLSGTVLFAITVNLCLIKKQCTALNLAVYIMEASRRESFQTFAKDLVA